MNKVSKYLGVIEELSKVRVIGSWLFLVVAGSKVSRSVRLAHALGTRYVASHAPFPPPWCLISIQLAESADESMSNKMSG
jgi:hypothetical protein